MTVVIKKSGDIASILEKIGSLPQKRRFKAQKHCGVIRLETPPLAIQQSMRDEWK
jgi:hypothetical protein